MDFKVRCVESSRKFWEVGKVYKNCNGVMYDEDGDRRSGLFSMQDVTIFFGSRGTKFELYEESKQFDVQSLQSGDWVEFYNGDLGQAFVVGIRTIVAKENVVDVPRSFIPGEIKRVVRPVNAQDFKQSHKFCGETIFPVPLRLTKSAAEKELSKIKGQNVEIVEE